MSTVASRTMSCKIISQVLAEIAFAKKRNEDRKVVAKEKRRAEMVSGQMGWDESKRPN